MNAVSAPKALSLVPDTDKVDWLWLRPSLLAWFARLLDILRLNFSQERW
jgi:hypothetical protein